MKAAARDQKTKRQQWNSDEAPSERQTRENSTFSHREQRYSSKDTRRRTNSPPCADMSRAFLSLLWVSNGTFFCCELQKHFSSFLAFPSWQRKGKPNTFSPFFNQEEISSSSCPLSPCPCCFSSCLFLCLFLRLSSLFSGLASIFFLPFWTPPSPLPNSILPFSHSPILRFLVSVSLPSSSFRSCSSSFFWFPLPALLPRPVPYLLVLEIWFVSFSSYSAFPFSLA